MDQWRNYIRATYHLNTEEFFFLMLALLFLSGALFLILLLFSSRITKSYQISQAEKIKGEIQKILNTIVVNETYTTTKQPATAFEYRMAELRSIIGNSDFASQVLIQQLLEIKKNLSGSSAQALIATYFNLGLDHFSFYKLRSFSLKKKAQGIRELTEMEDKKSIPAISYFLNSRNSVLREESFMALTRLEKDKPLFFLDDYHRELTLWMRINIHHYLAKLDQRKLPSFSKWFYHSNTDVSLFAISMAKQFRQAATIPDLNKMLSSDSPKIVGLAVEALGEMDAYDSAAEVASLASQVGEDEDLARRVIRCLGKIGNPEKDISIIGKFLIHPSPEIRFEAALALKKLGEQGEKYLHTFNDENGNSIDSILKHISEPLLSA